MADGTMLRCISIVFPERQINAQLKKNAGSRCSLLVEASHSELWLDSASNMSAAEKDPDQVLQWIQSNGSSASSGLLFFARAW